MAAMSQSKKEPMAVFGVLTDVQYADADNKIAVYNPSKTRFYRGSLQHVDEAFKYWEKSKVQFVLQLGDIIDGLNRINNASHLGLRRTLAHFEQHPSIPTFHTVGNHELYNFDRRELTLLFYESFMKLNLSPNIFQPVNPLNNSPEMTDVLYYKFSPTPGLKFISLDCFDVSVLGYNPYHSKYKEAAKILKSKHGHEIFEDWDCDGPLQGLDIRFQQMNGALGAEQLTWLDQELSKSDESREKVVVFGHVSLHPGSSDWSCLLWNYEEVMEVFHRYTCVIAYFNGHTHESGFAVDLHGISYISFAGILETPPDIPAFATVSVFTDRLEIVGQGMEKSYNIPFQKERLQELVKETVAENEVDIVPTTVKIKV